MSQQVYASEQSKYDDQSVLKLIAFTASAVGVPALFEFRRIGGQVFVSVKTNSMINLLSDVQIILNCGPGCLGEFTPSIDRESTIYLHGSAETAPASGIPVNVNARIPLHCTIQADGNFVVHPLDNPTAGTYLPRFVGWSLECFTYMM